MTKKYNKGDTVAILINPSVVDGVVTYDKKEAGTILGSYEISLYDSMSNGKSTLSVSYSVSVNGARKSFLEEELDVMQQFTE